MKRFYTSILFSALFLLSIFAKPVDEKTAAEIALIFTSGWSQFGEAEIDRIQGKYLSDGTLTYYIVHLKEKGWVLVSADDVVQPVLAFSHENSFVPESEWNDGAAYMLNSYKEQIKLAIADESLDQHPQWKELAQESQKKSVSENIEPFIDVRWNQSSGWNRFCPEDEDGPGGHVYVGCVAVAMAQAMSVYEYPVKGSGVKSYVHETYGSLSVNFDNEDPYDWASMSNTAPDDHNARLLYHCAVAAEMGFSGSGSGAWVRDAASAMKRFFNYSTVLDFISRDDYEEDWEEILVEELRAGRPLVYRGEPGNGTAGHAWNVDGYGGGYFHMNFGWSGSQNDYYSLASITPGSSDFTTNQGAIIGIRPPDSMPYDINLSASSLYEQQPEGTFVAVLDVKDEDPENIYTYTCMGPFSILFDGRAVSNDFCIVNDTLQTLRSLEYSVDIPESNFKNILIKVRDQYGNQFKKEFDIEVLRTGSGATAVDVREAEKVTFYPNPANDYLYISGESDQHILAIYDLTGKEVLGGIYQNMVDVSSLNNGIYILKLDSPKGKSTQKILIQR